MKPSDKQLAAGTMAFNSHKSVVIPDCISAAYDAMTEAITVQDVPERVRREIEGRLLYQAADDIAEDVDTRSVWDVIQSLIATAKVLMEGK